MLLEEMANKLIEWMHSKNFSKNTIKRFRNTLNRIIAFYDEHGRSEYDPKITEEFLLLTRSPSGSLSVSTLRTRRKCAALLDSYFEKRTFEWKLLSPQKIAKHKLNPYYEEIVKEFKNYWSKRGNWGKETLNTQLTLLKQFLEYLQLTSVFNIRDVNIKVIVEYLEYAKIRHPNSLQEVCGSIRYLGDFLKGAGIESADLRLITPVVPGSRTLMPSFTDDEVVRIFSEIDNSAIVGKRDYAILLLSAKLGLSSVDVANLKLTDIDWYKAPPELRFARHKTDGGVILPIEDDVGNAIADYILNARPKIESSFIFITARAPYRELQSAGIEAITSRYMNKAGFERGQKKGTHSFRRHFATSMLNAGVTYDKICEVLGHRQPHTLKSYIRTNSEGLSECALTFTDICPVSGVLQ